VPTPTARIAMLEQNMKPLSHNVTKEGMKRIAETLHGFVAADIYGLAQAAAMRVMTRCAPRSQLSHHLCLNQHGRERLKLSLPGTLSCMFL
jgi:hypothetical protein